MEREAGGQQWDALARAVRQRKEKREKRRKAEGRDYKFGLILEGDGEWEE